MTLEEQAEWCRLDQEERNGKHLTGAEKGRLADLRRAEILDAVRGMLPAVSPVMADVEKR